MPMKQSQWITEVFEDQTAFSVRYSGRLLDERSDFQRIEIYDTDALGRVLLLNGCFMVTEKDAYIYHEMLVHPAMAVLPGASKALVIGGGDGGAVTELVKYPTMESITLCEIDPMVVRSCMEHLPGISSGLGDPRVNVIHEDGAAFVKNSAETYDLVLVDSTDPVGPGKALFEVSFFESIRDRLEDHGAAVLQTESPIFMSEVFSSAVKNLGSVFGFDRATPYFATIPCYPGGLWSFTFCSASVDPVRDCPSDSAASLPVGLRYYDLSVHRAAFAMPGFVRAML